MDNKNHKKIRYFSELAGEVLTHIDCDESDCILLRTKSGREILIHHSQDCCESVYIVDTKGNWHNLIGKPLLEVSHDEDSDSPFDTNNDSSYSYTNTTLTFRVDDATVINRWFGSSNGYYSESVSLVDLTKKDYQ